MKRYGVKSYLFILVGIKSKVGKQSMINKNTMDELNRLGFGADIDALESYVASLQDAAGLGNPQVTDTVYDQHFKLLKQLRPDSYVLSRNWESEDNDLNEFDVLLREYGMSSINTVQNMQDLREFKDALGNKTLDMFASIKLNGHATRAVYVRGQLRSGSTRGRYKKGRDITRHLKATLPNYVEDWKDIRIVEVRSEALVSLERFERVKAYLRTPLSAVTSFIRESVTDAELANLSCVSYKILSSDPDVFHFSSLEEEFKYLENHGFNIPHYCIVKDVNIYNLDSAVEDILSYFGQLADNGELHYSTDGVVCAINDNDTFYSLGKNGNHFLGNFALKMGEHWESNMYSAQILRIEWVYGKSYITPKAIIEPVTTVTGTEVRVVPLYNVSVMEKYKYIPGNQIYFKFGGETGVTCLAPDGSSISGI